MAIQFEFGFYLLTHCVFIFSTHEKLGLNNTDLVLKAAGVCDHDQLTHETVTLKSDHNRNTSGNDISEN